MSHDQLRALLEHGEETGCVNLSAFTQVLTELEIDDAIEASVQEMAAAIPAPVSLKQLGQIMKASQAKLAGKTFDGKVLSEKVKTRLS